jgi:hypothetical protein
MSLLFGGKSLTELGVAAKAIVDSMFEKKLKILDIWNILHFYLFLSDDDIIHEDYPLYKLEEIKVKEIKKFEL